MKPIYLFVLIGAAAALGIVAGALIVREPPDFHAIVDRKGDVVLCVSKGEILFADRCVGSGRLTIVQPFEEGPITWRTVTGTVTMENEAPQNPACATSRATWKPGSEKATPSGKRIRKTNPADVSFANFPAPEEFRGGVFNGFSLDLNNDGIEDIVFTVDNLDRIVAEFEKNGQSSIYLVSGGILRGHSPPAWWPNFFHFDRGSYQGGTDTITEAKLIGIVPASPETGEIALLVTSKDRNQRELVRVVDGIQQIQTIYRRCD